MRRNGLRAPRPAANVRRTGESNTMAFPINGGYLTVQYTLIGQVLGLWH